MSRVGPKNLHFIRGQACGFQDRSGFYQSQFWGRGDCFLMKPEEGGKGGRRATGVQGGALLISLHPSRKQSLLRRTHPSRANSLQLQHEALIMNVKKTEHEINSPLVNGHRATLH